MIKNIVWNFQLPSTYIKHHLTHLKFNLIKLSFLNKLDYYKYSFWNLNVDSLLISFFLGLIFLLFVKYTINSIKYNKSFNKIQTIVDILILFVYKNMINICGKKNKYIFSLTFTVFTWILLMNLFGLLPADLLQYIFNLNYFSFTPTTDLNITLSMSLSVFLLIILYKLYNYNINNLIKEIIYYPFNCNICIPLNIILEIINFFSKILSLSLRLFGNIYSGEIIFLLVYYIIPWWLQFFFIIPLALLHILISFLQSFIFMILTLIYIS